MRRLFISVSFLCLISFGANAQDAQFEDLADFPLPIPSIMAKIDSNPAKIRLENLKEGDVFFRVPFKYRRTAELKSDFYGPGLFGGKVLRLKAGAVGYWAGTFESVQKYGGTSFSLGKKSEVWCFFGKNQNDEQSDMCLEDIGGQTNILSIYGTPYILKQFSKANVDLPIDRPIFEEKANAFGEEIEFVYKVAKIRKDRIDVKIEVRNTVIDTINLSLNKKTNAFFYASPIGDLDIEISQDLKSVSFKRQTGGGQPKLVEKTAPSDAEILTAIGKFKKKIELNNSKPKFQVNFLDSPNVSQSFENIKRGQLIAKQKFVPTQAFLLKTELEKDGYRVAQSGTNLFPIDPDVDYYEFKSGFKSDFIKNLKSERNSPPIVCGYDFSKLSQILAKDKTSLPTAFCLGDADGDEKYEYLWRSVVFAHGSIYNPISLSRELKISDTIIGAAEIQKTDIKPYPPEVLGIYFAGASGAAQDESGNIRPTDLRFEYRFETIKTDVFNKPDIHDIILLDIDKDGKAKVIIDDKTFTEVNKINADGSIEAVFRDFYPVGPTDYINYKRKSAFLSEQVKLLENMLSENAKREPPN